MSTSSKFSFNQLTQPASTVSKTPPSGFDANVAYTLGLCCDLTYTQYAKYPTALPQTGQLPNGVNYKMIGDPIMTSEAIGTSTVVNQSGDYRTFPAGFLMQCTDGRKKYNVLALRGTQTYEEWIKDADAFPTGYLVGDNGGSGYESGWVYGYDSLGSIHGGFYNVYTQGENGKLPVAQKIKKSHYEFTRPTGSICAGVDAALNDSSFNKTLPLYVTGHSLGAALAVLCALDIGTNYKSYYKKNSLSMYNLAGPAVGAGLSINSIPVPGYDDPATFVSNFRSAVDNSFRIVNAADIVPISPPASLTIGYAAFTFEHAAANEVAFCAQTGSIGGNHSSSDTYVPYLKQLADSFSVATEAIKKKVKLKKKKGKKGTKTK
jgi:hypothetical protein